MRFKIILFKLIFILLVKNAHTQVLTNETFNVPNFLDFVNKYSEISNEYFNKIANEIQQISKELKQNNSSSQCYQVIEDMFRSGFQVESSAKSIYSPHYCAISQIVQRCSNF